MKTVVPFPFVEKHLRRVVESVLSDLRESVECFIDHGCVNAAPVMGSPIEMIFMTAFAGFAATKKFTGSGWGGRHCMEVVPVGERWSHEELCRLGNYHPLFLRGIEVGPLGHPWGTMDYVMPQYEVGSYRADFVITRVCADGRGVQSHTLAVECDGKDYHDANEGQVSRDRKRDRFFQVVGIPAMRFSGSELHADPFKCAMDVDEALTTGIYAARLVPNHKPEDASGV